MSLGMGYLAIQATYIPHSGTTPRIVSTVPHACTNDAIDIVAFSVSTPRRWCHGKVY